MSDSPKGPEEQIYINGQCIGIIRSFHGAKSAVLGDQSSVIRGFRPKSIQVLEPGEVLVLGAPVFIGALGNRPPAPDLRGNVRMTKSAAATAARVSASRPVLYSCAACGGNNCEHVAEVSARAERLKAFQCRPGREHEYLAFERHPITFHDNTPSGVTAPADARRFIPGTTKMPPPGLPVPDEVAADVRRFILGVDWASGEPPSHALDPADPRDQTIMAKHIIHTEPLEGNEKKAVDATVARLKRTLREWPQGKTLCHQVQESANAVVFWWEDDDVNTDSPTSWT